MYTNNIITRTKGKWDLLYLLKIRNDFFRKRWLFPLPMTANYEKSRRSC